MTQSSTYPYARRGEAVVAYVERLDIGTVRIAFADVARVQMLDASHWEEVCPFTSLEISSTTFESLSLSDTQLSDIGLSIVARLSALAK